MACVVAFAVFTALWGENPQNAFVHIGGTYSAVPPDVDSADRAIYFAIFALTGVTFSRIGEELLYRGRTKFKGRKMSFQPSSARGSTGG